MQFLNNAGTYRPHLSGLHVKPNGTYIVILSHPMTECVVNKVIESSDD